MPSVSYSIGDEKYADFKQNILAVHPVPIDINNDPIMSEDNWIREIGRLHFIELNFKGQRKRAIDNLNLRKDLQIII